MPTEVEAKFRAETAGPLGRARFASASWARGARARLAPSTRSIATWTPPTAGWRPHAGRAAFARGRARRGSRSRARRSGRSSGWRHRRPEVEGPATDVVDPDGWPASPALELLERRCAAGQPLVERLRLYQARTERAVTLADGTSLGTLTLDRVRMTANGTDLGRLFVVELELDAVVRGRRRPSSMAWRPSSRRPTAWWPSRARSSSTRSSGSPSCR